MPSRVPEGPIDPYEPFPFDGPTPPTWSRAPIVKGSDLARDVTLRSAVVSDATEAEFVDVEEVGPSPHPLDSAIVGIPVYAGDSDEVVVAFDGEGSVHQTDDARFEGLGPGGDSYDGWGLVDGEDIHAPEVVPVANVVVDPWTLVPADESATHGSVDAPGFATQQTPAQPAEASTTQASLAPNVVRYGGPPMSSRAILLVGSLALLCLALAAALAFQAIRAPEAPALDAPTAAPASVPAQAPGRAAAPNLLLESLPVSDTTLTSIERAAMGPLELEIGRLGRALQGAFGRSSSEVAPVLRPYVAHAASRMLTHPARFRLVVTAPTAPLAAARAEAILRAFEAAGLPADMLTMTAGVGAPAVRFDR